MCAESVYETGGNILPNLKIRLLALPASNLATNNDRSQGRTDTEEEEGRMESEAEMRAEGIVRYSSDPAFEGSPAAQVICHDPPS